ncbi:transporter substrate-binding domain-containing protein [Vibrio sp. Isolate24]|uniref:substrate-binding periplasmic protein n=1 Tax=Vibrio sp. Isolate24 TaxID=2908534 RepID=UPI001EFC4E69|nr:transporter substrate-binding domain-containing protein [Vibrio sp. Isolate24]MCG9680573.1 transporter substrate-binding domain-containing protein [Vibrio sp. Isolate24]
MKKGIEKLKKFLLGIPLLSYFICVQAYAENIDKTVRITAGEWPPFIGQNLEGYGVVAQTITQAFALQGYKVTYTFYPWARAYEKAQSGEFDATAVWMFDDERTQHFYYSKPVSQEQFVFFHHKDLDFEWSEIEDLKGYKLGGGLGYSYGPELDALIESKGVTMSRVNSPSQNLLRLNHHRIEVYPEERQIGLYNLSQQTKDVQNNITYHPKPFLNNDGFVMFSKQSPRGKELLAIFNQGLLKWRQQQNEH